MEAKKLLIVESPAKAKTIGKYLGDDFLVKASVGHVRDLPRKSVAVKIAPDAKHKGDWTFSPCYEISADKKKIVEELRKAAKASSEIYLAPDPDREGEAIAWHLKTVLESAAKGKPFHRVTYNEITRNAVMAAVANPGEIDLRRVDAQQARRILDRLVGYKVSPLLWKHLNYGYTLSAGRVQSVALRLLVERQREIDSFTPVAYWVMGVEAKKGSGPKFTARLARIDGEKASVTDEQQSMMILGDLDQVSLSVRDVKSTQRTRHPMPPFTTSSLQQAASSVCGFSPKVTMGLAQKLYEEGLITYMRTDSVNIAAVARDAARKLISEKYGAEFTPEKPNFYKSKGGAQEAHEAIRPTDVAQEPGSIKLDAKSAKLYDLIWRRFVASQMSDARLSLRTVVISADRPGICHDYEFTASATSVDFEGFLKVMNKLSVKERKPEDEESDEVDSLPPLSKGDALTAVRWISDRKETKPPPHYSEAALVKALEENGVGRPSTYAATVETLVTRQYAERTNRQLLPTQRGMDVNDWLVKKLDSLFAVDYTAKMEEELDEIEEGKVGFDSMLSNFYRKFAAALEAAKDPPPPTEKFDEILAVLNDVTEWREPVSNAAAGHRVVSDREFMESVREQKEKGEKPLSAKQLDALVKLAVSYRDRIPDGERRIEALGYGPEIDSARNAPSDDLVRWCFQTIDRIGGLQKNQFLASLREQVDRGKTLTTKQFSILARSVGENAGNLEDCEAVRARLSPYVPEGFAAIETDPAVPGLLKLLESVKTWKEPAKRGRRVYDDEQFYSSLRDQYARRSSLSPRQVLALRRVCANYRDQIPDYAEHEVELGLDKLPSRAAIAEGSRASAEKDAKADERASRRRGRKSSR